MKILNDYFKILDKEKKPRFKTIDLEPRIKEAHNLLKTCELCERKCKVNRLKGEKGFCEVTDKMLVSSFFSHLGEEPFLVPSFTVFFWSCTFACQFCQNYDLSQRLEQGTIFSEEELAEKIDQHQICKNINFVGGDPVPQLPFILKTLKLVKADLPVVWNSNFYMSLKSMKLLKGIVDIYLSDFKYGNDSCAEKLSKVKNYWKIITRNHELAFKDSTLVIRHLVMPNHFTCCTKKIFDYLAEKFGDKVIVNVMRQYRPCYTALKIEGIDRPLSNEEFSQAVNYAKEKGLNYIT